MDKIKILSLSIFVILILGELKESRSQFSLAKENYHPSFMPPTITKGSSSSTIVSPDSNEKRLTIVDKIIFAPTGAVFGAFWGFAVGAVISRDFPDGIKGGVIGLSIGPFITYEMFAAKRGVKNPLHKFYLKTGGNLALTNHGDSMNKFGYSIGIGRHYHLTNQIGLRGEATYAYRQFSLPIQKIRYNFYYERVVKSYDIDFSVGYINTSVLLNFKLFSLRNLNFNVSLGPSLSIVVSDDTKFHFIKEEDNPDDYDFSYLDREGPQSGYPAMFYQLELQMDHWMCQLGFHHSVYDTDEIYPLDSNTRLRTLELSIGYKL